MEGSTDREVRKTERRKVKGTQQRLESVVDTIDVDSSGEDFIVTRGGTLLSSTDQVDSLSTNTSLDLEVSSPLGLTFRGKGRGRMNNRGSFL